MARQLFSERGYAAVATGEIVHAAEVTRGALYHHFSGKSDLFLAVYEDASERLHLGLRIATLEMLLQGLRARPLP